MLEQMTWGVLASDGPLTARALGERVSDTGDGWGCGDDRAYGACRALERRGLVRRLDGRPVRWEAVADG